MEKTRIEKRFGVFFEYDDESLEINVYRLGWDKKSKSDLLTSIWLDEPINKSEFEDECACWCDRHAA